MDFLTVSLKSGKWRCLLTLAKGNESQIHFLLNHLSVASELFLICPESRNVLFNDHRKYYESIFYLFFSKLEFWEGADNIDIHKRVIRAEHISFWTIPSIFSFVHAIQNFSTNNQKENYEMFPILSTGSGRKWHLYYPYKGYKVIQSYNKHSHPNILVLSESEKLLIHHQQNYRMILHFLLEAWNLGSSNGTNPHKGYKSWTYLLLYHLLIAYKYYLSGNINLLIQLSTIEL